jgi:hypothetical protein
MAHLSLTLAALGLLTSLAAAQPPEAAVALARRCGLDAWPQVEELRYTFNVQSLRGETHRSWIWRPREDTVTRQVSGEPDVVYSRDQLTGAEDDPLRRVDGQFINDQYWLLFPLHLVWDTGVAVTDDGPQPAPFDLGSLPRLTAAYGSEEGYTPGDVYELHLGEEGLPVAWTFHGGGTGDPRPMTWEGWTRFGPLLIATEHRNPDSGTRLWFSDVAVVAEEAP